MDPWVQGTGSGAKADGVEGRDATPAAIPDHWAEVGAQPVLGTARSLGLLALLFAVFVGVSILYIAEMNRLALEAAAVDNARRYAEVVTAFRTTYTAEVVGKAEKHGMQISHDTSASEAIPLPATMSFLIGEQLGGTGTSAFVKL